MCVVCWRGRGCKRLRESLNFVDEVLNKEEVGKLTGNRTYSKAVISRQMLEMRQSPEIVDPKILRRR